FVDAGGLMTYGTDLAEMYRRVARYVVRIMNGEKPGDLPVQQPEKFELIVNVKAAGGMGRGGAPSILATGGGVVEWGGGGGGGGGGGAGGRGGSRLSP